MKLTEREVEILKDAVPVYIEQQLGPGEEEEGAFAAQLAERLTPEFTPTPRECRTLSEAADAYLYWEVSDPIDRDSGYVYFDNDDMEEGDKMYRDDRDPEYVEECREVNDLSCKLEAHAS